MRLVDVDEVIAEYDRIHEGEAGKARKLMENAPTVDAVPVIRCKNCKFSKAYYHGSESNLGMFTSLCTQGLYGMNADGYCSMAERKEE